MFIFLLEYLCHLHNSICGCHHNKPHLNEFLLSSEQLPNFVPKKHDKASSSNKPEKTWIFLVSENPSLIVLKDWRKPYPFLTGPKTTYPRDNPESSTLFNGFFNPTPQCAHCCKAGPGKKGSNNHNLISSKPSLARACASPSK